MSNIEAETLLRAVFQKITGDTHDLMTIGKRSLAYAQALDCPSAKRLPMAILAERLRVSRQAIYKAVDKSVRDLAEIKGECQRPGCQTLDQ
jgi:hypothetical protein